MLCSVTSHGSYLRSPWRTAAACLLVGSVALAIAPANALAQKYPAVQPEPPDPAPGPAPEPGPQPADPEPSDDGGGGSSAKAQELMPPATQAWYFTGGVGPTFYDLTRSPKPNKLSRTGRFRLGLDIGYHLNGTFEGPAIGFALEQSFDGDLYTLNPAFKFLWDIQVVDDLAIYVAPFGKAGYVLGAAKGGPFHAFNLGAGAEGRVVFNDFAMAYLRPIQIDTFFGDFLGDLFVLNYSLMIGGGLTF